MRTTASPPTVQKTGTAINVSKEIGSTFVLKQVYITLFDKWNILIQKKKKKKEKIKKKKGRIIKYLKISIYNNKINNRITNKTRLNKKKARRQQKQQQQHINSSFFKNNKTYLVLVERYQHN